MNARAEKIDLSADKAQALKLVAVSHETEKRLDALVETLLLWQKRTNLVATSTLQTIWTRHVADSLQLLDLSRGDKAFVDFGSGGGFPGLVIACALEDEAAVVHLVESNGKKVAFLREAIRQTGAKAKVHHMRAEDFAKTCAEAVDVVTARALASLKVLCDQAFPLIEQGARGLFLKGQDVDAELTEASKYWTIEADKVPSKTSPDGCIVVVRSLSPRTRVKVLR